MIISTWQKVLSGEQTQIAMPVKNTATLQHQTAEVHDGKIIAVHGAMDSGYIYWLVGNTYAVQPARAKRAIWWRELVAGSLQTTLDPYCPETVRKYSPAMLKHDGWQEFRVRILRIRELDTRNISHADAVAQGAYNMSCAVDQLLSEWCHEHDKQSYDWRFNNPHLGQHECYPDFMFTAHIKQRPVELYQAWVLDFELVK